MWKLLHLKFLFRKLNVLLRFRRYQDPLTRLCQVNKISQPSVVKIISKKQLFFKVKRRFKHGNSILKTAKKIFWPPGHDFLATRFDGNKRIFFLGLKLVIHL